MDHSFEKDVLIIGAGAAGMMCAAEVAKRKRSVLLIEHSEKAGKKILISGGGRCNFTNKNASHINFISDNPHFCKSALSRYAPDDFISLVEKHNIHYHEKKDGQLFCDDSSKQIVAMLLKECSESGAEVITDCTVQSVKKNHSFVVETSKGIYTSESLVIATGGLSIPKMGATDFGYRTAKQFGIRHTDIRPGLVPLLFKNDFTETFGQLSGISVDSYVSYGKTGFRENILFTHRGLSGPAILQISSYCRNNESISVNLLPELNFYDILKSNSGSRSLLVNFLSEYFPKRFAQSFCEKYLPAKSLNQLTEKELKEISDKLHNWHIIVKGSEGFSKAEVTCGGIDTDELSSKTMESKKVKGLYFIGEVVDVTGWLGGYNFQWAWASGFAAGQFV